MSNPWQKFSAVAAVAMLLATTGGAIPITVTNTAGSGADVQFTGWSDAGAVDAAANTDQMNVRTTATRNEITALRFDMTGYPPANYTNYSIGLVNQRANTAATLFYYAVRDGAVGEDNNGTSAGYTDNTWSESAVLFSTMPGLHWANTATTDQIPNADALLLGSATMNNTAEGSLVTFSSPALTAFMQTNSDNLVTFLIVRTDLAASSQARFASKEATVLASGGTGIAGSYAPRLTFSPNCESAYVIQNPANQSVNLGSTATFTVNIGGTVPTYQWQLSTDGGTTWNDITLNGTSASYTTPASVVTDAGNKYRCVANVACDASSITSAAATLTLNQTDIWVGPASGGEWNTAGNWNLGAPPLSSTTNALIGLGTNVNYNSVMSANPFGTLLLKGILNVNAGGFNSGAVTMTNNTAKIFVNNGGTVNVTGGITLLSNAVVSIASGGALTTSGTLTMGSSVAASGFGILTNNGGALTLGGLSLNPNNASIATSCRVVIAGGTNSLGVVAIARSPGGNSAPPAMGTDDLIISNGIVNMRGITLGNNAHGIIYLVNGLVTNNGTFTIQNNTATRPARFVQTGGTFVNTNTVTLQGAADTVYAALGGTNSVAGFRFNGITVLFTNNNKMYVGSAGITVSTTNTTTTALLNASGSFGATADWTNAAAITLNGGSFDCQDASGTPHNIYSIGALQGSGSVAMIKNGPGTLTLGAVNGYLGSTLINQGTLALDAGGAIATSAAILVGPGTMFDVSAVSGGYVQSAGKTLGGMGVITGDVNMASGAIIDPGTNAVTGSLSFSNSLIMTGGAKTHFDLSTNPSGPNNDVVVIQGSLNVSGVSNIVEISGGGAAGSIHPLFKYYGSFVGDVSSFTLVGPTGVITNITSTTPNMIAFVPMVSLRSPTNVVWVGNATVNDWDVLAHTNWINGAALDIFMANDSVAFTAAGGANTNVNLPVPVTPSAVTVNSAGNYFLSGAGGIGGATALTKTNSGTLFIQLTNQFTGGVNLKGGTISVASLADDGVDSPIGRTGTLLVDGGTLDYSGPSLTWARSITLGTNGQDGLSISDPAATLNQLSPISGGGALTKTGNGTLTLNGNNTYGGGTILNAGNLLVNNVVGAGTGTISLNAGTLQIAAVKPANTIDVPGLGSISGGNAGGLTGINRVTGSGPLGLAVTVGVFDLGGDMTGYSGTITFTNAGGAVVRLNGSTGSAAATWDLGAGPMDLNVRTGSTSNNIGALKGASGTTLSGRGGSSNNGATTYYLGANGLSTTFDGIIQNGSGGSSSITSINKVGPATLALSGGNTYSGSTTISSGTLALIGSGAIGSSSTVNIVSGAMLDVTGLGTPTFSLGGNQTLQGRGTVLGGLDSTSGLRIAPGNGDSLGTLTATNAITLGGTTWMKLNRASTPNSDKLVSTLSTITYGGALVVTNLGVALHVGDTFDLFDGAGLNGGIFSATNLPNYYTWDTSQLGVNGTVSITALLPLPSITTVDFSTLSGGSITLNAINGAPNGPVTVLSSTNLALPVSSWTAVTTTTFDGNGNLNLPVTVDPALPQSYYLLKVQ